MKIQSSVNQTIGSIGLAVKSKQMLTKSQEESKHLAEIRSLQKKAWQQKIKLAKERTKTQKQKYAEALAKKDIAMMKKEKMEVKENG